MADGRWLDDTGWRRPSSVVPTPRSDRIGRIFLWLGGVWSLLTLTTAGWWWLAAGEGLLVAVWVLSVHLESEARRAATRRRATDGRR